MGVSFSSTKLKVQLKTAIQRMTMSINKRSNSIRVEERVIASLLQNNKDESARIKAEGVIHAKNLITVMETLQLMCELLSTRIQVISHSTTPPEDLEESIATIVYCANRVEIPELEQIAQLLGAKYSEKYIRSHINNESNMVNPRVVDKLKISPPEFDVVLHLLQDIANQFSVSWKPDLGVLESGMRDSSNPERLGAIAGGPKPSGNPEYKEEEVKALPVPNSQLINASNTNANRAHSAAAVIPGDTPHTTYPATLNIIILQAKDFPPLDTNTEMIIKITQPETGLLWRSLPHSGANSNTLSWSAQHCPVAIHSPTMLIMVECVLHSGSGKGERVVGGLSIEAEQLRRSAQGTWYTLFAPGSHSPVGQLLLAAQFLSLPNEHTFTANTQTAPLPSTAPRPQSAAPAYHRPDEYAGSSAHTPAPPPPAYQEDILQPGGETLGDLYRKSSGDRELGQPLLPSGPGGPVARTPGGADSLEARFKALG